MFDGEWDVCLSPFLTSAVNSCMFPFSTSHLPLIRPPPFFSSRSPRSRPSLRENTSCTHSVLCVCCCHSKVKHTHTHTSLLFMLFVYFNSQAHFSCLYFPHTCLLSRFSCLVHFLRLIKWVLSVNLPNYCEPEVTAACVYISVENVRYCLSEYCNKRKKQNY